MVPLMSGSGPPDAIVSALRIPECRPMCSLQHKNERELYPGYVLKYTGMAQTKWLLMIYTKQI